MLQILIIAIVCLSSAFIGQVVFAQIPVVNWILGALAGLISMAIALKL